MYILDFTGSGNFLNGSQGTKLRKKKTEYSYYVCVFVKMQALDQKSTTEQKMKYFGDFSLGVILSVERYRYQATMLNSLAMASYQSEEEKL